MTRRRHLGRLIIVRSAACAAIAFLAGCDSGTSPLAGSASPTNAPALLSPPRPGTAQPVDPGAPPVFTYEVIHAWPHDRAAFTQGLVYRDGALFESTGLYRESSLRKVELETGKVLKKVDVPDNYFA